MSLKTCPLLTYIHIYIDGYELLWFFLKHGYLFLFVPIYLFIYFAYSLILGKFNFKWLYKGISISHFHIYRFWQWERTGYFIIPWGKSKIHFKTFKIIEVEKRNTVLIEIWEFPLDLEKCKGGLKWPGLFLLV